MQTIVGQANRNLNAVGSGLSAQVADLKGVLDKLSNESDRAASHVAEQIDALRDVSTGTLTRASDLATRLDTGNRELAQALARVAGDAGGSDLAPRADRAARGPQPVEPPQRHRGYGRPRRLAVRGYRIDHALLCRTGRGFAQGRRGACPADRRLAGRQRPGGTAAITEQFEAIRNTTGKERERTAHALRQAYEQVAAEVGGELTKVTTQFQTAAEELRAMTASIQSELESTRAELKRGVIDMPRETQEATAAMRRVVAEQIKALNDLSGLVTRSGRSLDVAEPVPSAPPPMPAAARRPDPLPEPRPVAAPMQEPLRRRPAEVAASFRQQPRSVRASRRSRPAPAEAGCRISSAAPLAKSRKHHRHLSAASSPQRRRSSGSTRCRSISPA